MSVRPSRTSVFVCLSFSRLVIRSRFMSSQEVERVLELCHGTPPPPPPRTRHVCLYKKPSHYCQRLHVFVVHPCRHCCSVLSGCLYHHQPSIFSKLSSHPVSLLSIHSAKDNFTWNNEPTWKKVFFFSPAFLESTYPLTNKTQPPPTCP